MDFNALATTFGVPVALLVALLLGLWRAGVWTASNVVKPLADRHILHLQHIEKSAEDQAESLRLIADVQRKQTELGQASADLLKAIHEQTLVVANTIQVGFLDAMRRVEVQHNIVVERLDKLVPIDRQHL